jgi:hypothetical protein
VSRQSQDEPHVPATEPLREAPLRDELRRPWRSWLIALRYGPALLAAFALVLVIGGEAIELENDLQIIAPEHATPGASLPVRALIYTRLQAIDGPSLRAQPIDVWLETSSGRELARARLSPAHAGNADVEGMLSLPNAVGEFRLLARARIGSHELRVSRALALDIDAVAHPPEGRPLRALQQFAPGALIAEPGERAPSALELQVAGGACAPEQPCRAYAFVAEPGLALHIAANSAISTLARSDAISSSAGVAALDFVTHGPEAELWLSVLRDGRPTARRALRLPIALGSARLEISAFSLDSASQFWLRLQGADADGCIVDDFVGGHWVRTGSRAHCERAAALPFALPLGLSRLQVRRDAFSARTAAVAMVYLRAPGESALHELGVLSREAARVAPDDPLLKAIATHPPSQPDAALSGYLAALLEAGIFAPPPSATAHVALLDQLHARQARLRTLSLVALALAALALVGSLGPMGLRAGLRASQLVAQGDRGASRRVRLRSFIVVAASVCALVLVFIVIGLYVLLRRG